MIARKQIENTIGKSFAGKLEMAVFEVQDWHYSRRDMVEHLGCANFMAAARLATVLRKLKIASAAQLHKTDPFSIARVRGIGEAAMFVAMCILDVSGYDVEVWWGWKQSNVLKFSTFKHKAIRRATARRHEVA